MYRVATATKSIFGLLLSSLASCAAASLLTLITCDLRNRVRWAERLATNLLFRFAEFTIAPLIGRAMNGPGGTFAESTL
jgi:hypothetical protein